MTRILRAALTEGPLSLHEHEELVANEAAGSVVGFESGDLGVVQLLCQRDGRPPLRRDWLDAER